MMETKPCPFCGSDESAFIDHEDTCFLKMLEKHNLTPYTVDEYATAWNTRVKEIR